MFGLWFFGMIAFWVYRLFWAGFKSKQLFYSVRTRYSQGETIEFDGEKVFNYVWISVLFGFTWLISLPAYGVYKLGQHLNKGE